MKRLNLTQGSDEWLAVRGTTLNASDAPVMMGVSKYLTRNDLLKAKNTLQPREFSKFVQERILDKGHEVEAMARPIAERLMGEELFPVTMIHDLEGLSFLASLDGMDMLGNVIFEHKTINNDLRATTCVEDLHEQYKVQMDHQLLVSGAEKCLFMASDGTEQDMVYFWYQRDEKRIQKLMEGWKLFVTDLESYKPPESAPEAVADEVTDLPGIVLVAEGAVSVRENFAVFEQGLKAFLEDRLILKPETDDDFATLEAQVKMLKKAEDMLKVAGDSVLAQVEAVDAAMKKRDSLAKLVRDNRLMAEKLVKSEKDARRAAILAEAEAAFSAWVSEQDCPAPIVSPAAAAIAEAMKGKKTIKSLQDAADAAVANLKLAAMEEIKKINGNHATFKEMAAGYEFLFPDWRSIILYDPAHVKAHIQNAISEHKQREAEKLEAGRERIRQEEEAKAKAAAEAQARAEIEAAAQQRQREEADRIAAEQRVAEINAPTMQATRPVNAVSTQKTLDDLLQEAIDKSPPDMKEDQESLNSFISGFYMGWKAARGES